MRLISTVILLAIVAGTGDLGAQNTPPPSALPSVALPPMLDRVLRDYEAAWSRGDAAGLAALFHEDGFVLQGGRPPVRGRAAIQTAYTGQGGSPLRLRALAAVIEDTVGYIIGAYGYGNSSEDLGKFTLTLRRRPGGPWLIFSDMDNSSRPARPVGTPPPDSLASRQYEHVSP